MQNHEVKERIESKLNAKCIVSEFSGGGDHYSVVVISKEFVGKSALQKHRMVLDLFQDEIDSGEVHALSIQAFTPEQWETAQKPK